MTKAEATALDPQLRKLLEIVYECLEDSSFPIENVAGSNISVFVSLLASGR
jgi:acyl transferase domain-containing protein